MPCEPSIPISGQIATPPVQGAFDGGLPRRLEGGDVTAEDYHGRHVADSRGRSPLERRCLGQHFYLGIAHESELCRALYTRSAEELRKAHEVGADPRMMHLADG